MKLRPYQRDAAERLRALARAKRSAVLVSPTGSGKTITACLGVIQPWVLRGGRAIFAVHLREVVDQAAERLQSIGVDCGVVMAGRQPSDAPVQVCSIGTLAARGVRPPADLVIIDECHRASSPTYERLVKAYPGAAVIGLTATPVRTDGKGLRPPDGPFCELVQAIQPPELIRQGALVDCDVYGPQSADLAKLKRNRRGLEYTARSSSQTMQSPQLIGDAVKEWHRLAKGQRTVCFAVDRAHAKKLADAYDAAGVRARYVDGATSLRARRAALDDLRRHKADVLVNVGVYTEGWDEPLLGCVQVAVPTLSLGRWLQMAGRGLRPVAPADAAFCRQNGLPVPHKRRVVIIDHGGNAARFGFPTAARTWSLEPRDTSTETARAEAAAMARRFPRCPACAYVLPAPAPNCPKCGAGLRESGLTLDAQLTQLRPGEVWAVTK